MATYTLTGSRFVRKYTAQAKTPTHATAADAELIASRMCLMPWQEVGGDLPAIFPSHTETSLDDNLAIRDQFDAANFCTGHEDGRHLAHANVACYRMVLPEGAVGLALTSLKARISCDPYCRDGARVAVNTNSTGEVPTACADCREGLAHASGVAPRTESSDHKTWYGATADATITPSSPITLGSYLYVFITLETPSYSRASWLEGAARALNSFEVTLSETIPDIADGATIDCSIPPFTHSATVWNEGPVYNLEEGQYILSKGLYFSAKGVNYNPADTTQSGAFTEVSAHADFAYAMHEAYRKILSGSVLQPKKYEISSSASHLVRIQSDTAKFVVSQRFGHDTSGTSITRRDSINIEFKPLRAQIAMPTSWLPRVIRFSMVNMSDENIIHGNGHIGIWIRLGEVPEEDMAEFFRNPSIFDCRDETVEGFRLIGKITSSDTGNAYKDIPFPPVAGERMATFVAVPFLPLEDALSLDEYYETTYNGINTAAAWVGGDHTDPVWKPQHITLLG